MTNREDSFRIVRVFQVAQKESEEIGLTIRESGGKFEVWKGQHIYYYPETVDDLASFVYGYKCALQDVLNEMKDAKAEAEFAEG